MGINVKKANPHRKQRIKEKNLNQTKANRMLSIGATMPPRQAYRMPIPASRHTHTPTHRHVWTTHGWHCGGVASSVDKIKQIVEQIVSKCLARFTFS